MRARCLNLSLKSLGCLCSPTLAKQYITRLMIFRYRRFCASNLRPPPSPPQPAGCSLPHCWAKLSLRFPSCTPQPSGLPLSVTFLNHLENFLQCRYGGLGAFASVATAEIHSGTRIRSKSGGSGESSPTELVLVQTLLWCKCKLPQPAGVPCWLVLWWYSTAVTASLPASQRPLFCTTYLHQAGLHQRHNGAPLI